MAGSEAYTYDVRKKLCNSTIDAVYEKSNASLELNWDMETPKIMHRIR